MIHVLEKVNYDRAGRMVTLHLLGYSPSREVADNRRRYLAETGLEGWQVKHKDTVSEVYAQSNDGTMYLYCLYQVVQVESL